MSLKVSFGHSFAVRICGEGLMRVSLTLGSLNSTVPYGSRQLDLLHIVLLV